MIKRTLAIFTLLALTSGCDEPVQHSEICRKVYDAFCSRANECGTIESLTECQLHYSEMCRTYRLHVGVTTPTEEEQQSCVDAIAGLDCTNADPALLPECGFLVVPDPDADVAEDAGPDTESSTDADDQNDTPVDTDPDEPDTTEPDSDEPDGSDSGK